MPSSPTPPFQNNKKLSDAAAFLQSLNNPEIVERVRATIQNAHVFKLPPRQSASVGWRGADWKEKVWQGTVKIVERGELTAVLLVDRVRGSIFAVCPVNKEGAVDRCVDSSRYFVLRIENANGRHMFIGVAFNERNDAFDFNTALQDSKRERQMEQNPSLFFSQLPHKDYSIKEGEKIKVSIPGGGGSTIRKHHSTTGAQVGGKPSFLKPSSRDTPGRATSFQGGTPGDNDVPGEKQPLQNFFGNETDPFPSESFGGTNFFAGSEFDDQSTGSGNPFFKKSAEHADAAFFDPRQYKTER